MYEKIDTGDQATSSTSEWDALAGDPGLVQGDAEAPLDDPLMPDMPDFEIPEPVSDPGPEPPMLDEEPAMPDEPETPPLAGMPTGETE